MKPLNQVVSAPVPLKLANLDTDQIIPGRFLRKLRGDGYHPYLFHDLRRESLGELRGDFPLNMEKWAGAEILVADRNFGGGSSREAAVYALVDSGIRVVIAPSFGDIFYSNATKNGLLPIVLPREEIERIWEQADADSTAPLTVDLEAQQVRLANDPEPIGFEIEAFRRDNLLNGLDDIELTLKYAGDIDGYEAGLKDAPAWRVPRAR